MKRELQNGRFITAYDPGLALIICERIADGETLKTICDDKDKFPHRTTFHRWVVNNPKLALAYGAARELSATGLEEEAIGIAREIQARAKKVTSPEVRAYEVAMNQLRWSAERRDPKRFSTKGAVSVTVPIQINTSLDMGSGEAQGTPDHPDIYQLQATVEQPDPELESLVPNRSTVAGRERIKAKRRRAAMDSKAAATDREMYEKGHLKRKPEGM
jgi:hypothetical protein